MEEHMTPAKLERYAFFWLIGLLALSAIAMLLGARPLAHVVFGYSSNSINSLLNLSWIISGVAALFLAYQWTKHSKQVFGGNDKKDLAAFLIMLLTGFNLGIYGILGQNYILNINDSFAYLIILSALCIWSGYHLWTRWTESGERVFVGDQIRTKAMASAETSSADAEKKEAKPVVDGMNHSGGKVGSDEKD